MPELPEVETVCRGLAKAFTDKKIVRVEQHRADLRAPMPKNLPTRLKGRKIIGVARRAKYILMDVGNNETLLLHLGMSGRMLIDPQAVKAEKHDHLVFHFDDGSCLRFNDPRRFGSCDLVATPQLAAHKSLKHLGIEPLSKDLTPAKLAALFRTRTAAVKLVIMDQRLIVGVGNIYASEALFHAGINPQRAAGKCTKEQLVRLAPAIKKVLKAAIAAGGSSLRDYRQTNGELGYFQHHFAVYGRMGQPCPNCTCAIAKTGGIQRLTQGGRSTYFCAQKQQ